MHTVDLGVDHEIAARLSDAFDAEPTSVQTRPAGIVDQGEALHQHRVFRLDHFVGAVVGVAVVDADHARGTIL